LLWYEFGLIDGYGLYGCGDWSGALFGLTLGRGWNGRQSAAGRWRRGCLRRRGDRQSGAAEAGRVPGRAWLGSRRHPDLQQPDQPGGRQQRQWRQSTDRRIYGLSGTLNTAGSTVHRVSGDGTDVTYSWDTTRSAYVPVQVMRQVATLPQRWRSSGTERAPPGVLRPERAASSFELGCRRMTENGAVRAVWQVRPRPARSAKCHANPARSRCPSSEHLAQIAA